MTRHRSMVWINPIPSVPTYRRGLWHREQNTAVTSQFRYVIRLAHACDRDGIEYDITWIRFTERMQVSIAAAGNLPAVRPLPKPRNERSTGTVAWKPRMFEAEYRLETFQSTMSNRRVPGFVIEHSCGLSLVLPSSDGEWPEDATKGWLLTQSKSGLGFGLTLSFQRAVKALLEVAGMTDWNAEDRTALSREARLAGLRLQCRYQQSSWMRHEAERKLEELESQQPENERADDEVRAA